MPGKSHGQRSLAGYSSWGRKEWGTTEHTHSAWKTSYRVHYKEEKSQPPKEKRKRRRRTEVFLKLIKEQTKMILLELEVLVFFKIAK